MAIVLCITQINTINARVMIGLILLPDQKCTKSKGWIYTVHGMQEIDGVVLNQTPETIKSIVRHKCQSQSDIIVVRRVIQRY